MRFLLDTNVILNDFFHRHPDFGFQRIQNQEQASQVEQHRQLVHESLLWLSLQNETEVWTSTAILARFGSLLGDLLVPPDLVVEEMAHWLSQLKLAEIQGKHLQMALHEQEIANPRVDFDDYLLKLICRQSEIDVLVSSVPKSRHFYWPVLVFAPEKIRELNWENAREKPLQ